MNGISEEYFKTERRQAMLLNILFVWSSLHSTTSYRQGMHEITAPILYVLEQEIEEWAIKTDEMNQSFSFDTEQEQKDFFDMLNQLSEVMCQNDSLLESSVYWLFERIMRELEPLYSPVTGADEQPAIVHYCTKIQEHMLRGLDPQLCTHLEDNFIQAQLYGMRWSRLLLGREFELTEDSLLRIWDYMFACVLDAHMTTLTNSKHNVSHAHTSLKKLHSSQKDSKSNSSSSITQTPYPPSSESTSTPTLNNKISTNQKTSNLNSLPLDPLSGALYPKQEVEEDSEDEKEETHLIKRNESDSDDTDDDILWTTSSAVVKTTSRFAPSSPLLDALADFMLAMLLHVINLTFLFLVLDNLVVHFNYRFVRNLLKEIHQQQCFY